MTQLLAGRITPVTVPAQAVCTDAYRAARIHPRKRFADGGAPRRGRE